MSVTSPEVQQKLLLERKTRENKAKVTLSKNLARVVQGPDGPVKEDVDLVHEAAAEVSHDRLQGLR